MLLLATAGGCLLYDDSLLLPAPAIPPDAAGPDTTTPPVATGCALARWPDRPAVADVDGGGAVEFVNAVRTLDFGVGREAGVPRDFGFDLDGVCTCAPDRGRAGVESCRVPPGTAAHCDLDEGRDTTAASLVLGFSQVSNAFSQDEVNGALRDGYYGLLFRVTKYNGLADDPNVEVAVFGSGGNDGVQDGGRPGRPRDDGTDRWTIDPSYLQGGSAPPFIPLYRDVNAYVSNHRLVATMDFPVSFSGLVGGVASIMIDLTDSVVVGTIVRDGESYRIDRGTVAGRWQTTKLLTSLEVIPDPFADGGFLCGPSTTYALAKELVCSGQDIVSNLRRDNTGAPCDAVSLSIDFTSRPAVLGEVVPPPARPKPCGLQWVDDCPR